jgi:hypothetical protein
VRGGICGMRLLWSWIEGYFLAREGKGLRLDR